MPTLKIHGYGDRFISTEGIPGCSTETNVMNIEKLGTPESRTTYSGTMHVKRASGDIFCSIHALYTGLWSFAVAQDDGYGNTANGYSEDFRDVITRYYASDDPFSETVHIEVPDDAWLVFEGAVTA